MTPNLMERRDDRKLRFRDFVKYSKIINKIQVLFENYTLNE